MLLSSHSPGKKKKKKEEEEEEEKAYHGFRFCYHTVRQF
jgi:hypothetical protein